MHTQTLPDSLWELLPRLDGIPGVEFTYLGGGSAMALSLGHFLKGLVDFEEADQEGELAMIWDLSWEEIKSTLRKEVKGIARQITNESTILD
jgi:hypothetical protein